MTGRVPPAAQREAEPIVRTPEAHAREFIAEQADALRAARELVGPSFGRAVEFILAARSPMIVTGIGKSGLIARKIAATLASTGSPAMFMHPVEGVHGDLGAVSPGAVLLALSKSGYSEEVVKFVQHFRRVSDAGRVIAICESLQSPLAELADAVLQLPDLPEAGPLRLAPTTSTLLSLALGDALAMVLLERRGFSESDFGRFHPEGSLGRRLLLRAADLMHAGPEMPVVCGSAPVPELLLTATNKHLGMACIVHDDSRLVGVFTDGDLRRLLTRCQNPMTLTAFEAWRQSRRSPDEPPVKCSTIPPSTLAVECLRIMRESQITVLVVSNDGDRPDGILRLQDLVRAGIG